MNDPQPHTDADEKMLRWFKDFLSGISPKEHSIIKECLEDRFSPDPAQIQQEGYRADHERYIEQVKGG